MKIKKPFFPASIFIVFVIVLSCSFIEGSENSLTNDKDLYFSKRKANLVEQLFKDYLERDEKAEKLVKNIKQLKDETNDSIRYYNNFLNKNNQFFQDVKIVLHVINDKKLNSLTQKKYHNLDSLYGVKDAWIKTKIKDLKEMESKLNDQLLVFKVSKARILLDEFRKEKMPVKNDELKQKMEKVISELQKG